MTLKTFSRYHLPTIGRLDETKVWLISFFSCMTNQESQQEDSRWPLHHRRCSRSACFPPQGHKWGGNKQIDLTNCDWMIWVPPSESSHCQCPLNTQSDQSPTSESFSVSSAGPGHQLKLLLHAPQGGRERDLVIPAE